MVRVMALTARAVTIDCADLAHPARFWTAAGFARSVLADPEGNEFCVAEQD
jgi:hypothetical protein